MSEVFSWYSHWASRSPDKAALILDSKALSYAELYTRLNEERVRLDQSDIRPGMRVVLDIAPGSNEWLVGLLTGLAAGLQLILPDPDWDKIKLKAYSKSLRPEAALLYQQQLVVKYVSARWPTTRSSYSEAGPGVWHFTSGTTRLPRPHFRPITALNRMVARVKRQLPDDIASGKPVSLCIVPVYHGYGLINALLLPHALGGTVLCADASTPEAIQQHLLEAEMFYGWPLHYCALVENPGNKWKRRNKLKWSVSSSFYLEPAVARRFAHLYGCPVRQQYGLTETGPLCLDSAPVPIDIPACVGKPLDGIELCVLDNQGRRLNSDKRGRLAVRVAHESISGLQHAGEGFFDTGDIGMCDDEGRVFVYRRGQAFHDERKELYL